MFGGACNLVNVNVYLCRLSELCVSLSVVDVMFLIGIERSARKTPVLIYSSPFASASSQATRRHLVALGYLQG